MVTKEKIDKWQKRKKIEIHTQYAKDKNGFELKNKKMYDYYICDYCWIPIKLFPNKKHYKQEGGKVIIPCSLINNKSVEVAVHNRCIKYLIKELEELKNAKESNENE